MRCVFDYVYAFLPLATKIIGPRTGRKFFQKCLFFRYLPHSFNVLFKGVGDGYGDSFCRTV